jgi:hypothetical protein
MAVMNATGDLDRAKQSMLTQQPLRQQPEVGCLNPTDIMQRALGAHCM